MLDHCGWLNHICNVDSWIDNYVMLNHSPYIFFILFDEITMFDGYSN